MFPEKWQYYLKVLLSLSLNVLTTTDFYLFIRCFNIILNSVTSPAFYNIYIKQPTLTTPLNPCNNPKFNPFFQDALGAFDGTCICAHPPALARAHYCNCKSGISQNVLA